MPKSTVVLTRKSALRYTVQVFNNGQLIAGMPKKGRKLAKATFDAFFREFVTDGRTV